MHIEVYSIIIRIIRIWRLCWKQRTNRIRSTNYTALYSRPYSDPRTRATSVYIEAFPPYPCSLPPCSLSILSASTLLLRILTRANARAPRRLLLNLRRLRRVYVAAGPAGALVLRLGWLRANAGVVQAAAGRLRRGFIDLVGGAVGGASWEGGACRGGEEGAEGPARREAEGGLHGLLEVVKGKGIEMGVVDCADVYEKLWARICS